MNFDFAIEVLKNELFLQKSDYYSFSEKKNQELCMRNQINLEQAISILQKTVMLSEMFKDPIVVGEKAGEVK